MFSATNHTNSYPGNLNYSNLNVDEKAIAKNELTDAEFTLIESLLPTGPRPGRPWRNNRQMFNGLFWKLNTGAVWHDIPPRYGSWDAIYQRYKYLRRHGTWNRIMEVLQIQFDSNERLVWKDKR
jgi:transposase